jgi:hypothetical protein
VHRPADSPRRHRAGTAQTARSTKEDNEAVIDKAELRRMSQAERRELARLLAELRESAASEPDPSEPDPSEPDPSEPDPDRADPFDYDPVLRRERPLALLVSAGCCVILAGWIVVLAATLPHHFDAHHWRTVWVNFDVILLAAFGVTAWAIWRERQILILLLVLVGTMLFCDAWFDVGTSLSTSGFWISLLSALFAELPLAILAFLGARRLLRATVAAAFLAGEQVPPGQAAPAAAVTPTDERDRAGVGKGHSLRRTPLAGKGLDEALPRGRAERRAERAGRARQSA